MRLTCGGCGAHGSYEFFTSDTEARAAFAAAQKLPGGMGGLLLDYLTLFRPPKRLLTWKRARALIDELAPMVIAGEVRRDHRRHTVTLDAWRAAIEKMLAERERLTLPLKSHGYLLTIVVGEAPKLAAAAETAAEEAKRLASAARTGSRAAVVAEWASEQAAMRRLKLPELSEEQRAEFFAKRGFEP